MRAYVMAASGVSPTDSSPPIDDSGGDSDGNTPLSQKKYPGLVERARSDPLCISRPISISAKSVAEYRASVDAPTPLSRSRREDVLELRFSVTRSSVLSYSKLSSPPNTPPSLN